jgi:hypothetical protein
MFVSDAPIVLGTMPYTHIAVPTCMYGISLQVKRQLHGSAHGRTGKFQRDVTNSVSPR